jgi:cyclophilin family peptidyl-prolyl cis-trans isomerase
MGDRRAGVAVTALEASASWLLDDEISDVLVRTIRSGNPHFRETALWALVDGGDPRGLDFVYQFAGSEDPSLRRLAARGLTSADDLPLLEALFNDSDAGVRVAALDTLIETKSDRLHEQVSTALEDTDPAVTGTAFEWLAGHPVLPAEDLSRALASQQKPDLIEVRLNATEALAARGREEPLERGLVVQNLESLAQVGDFPARRAAADALSALGRDRPTIAPAETRKTASTYEDILLIMDEPKLVEIMTRHGAIRVRLQCPTTPMTCLNFLQLTNQGFYDGLQFHRVVPDFVVQGGDPRGDGWGGPGYTIRDELNRLPFGRGVIGMASAGPDTAGSQFFVTLSRQPHLDGLYTAFGEVVHGLDLLESIVQGDRIESIREIR